MVPAADRPPAPTLIHLAFNAMVGVGFLLVLAAVWSLAVWWRRRALPVRASSGRSRALSGPAALIAMECGWIVTEVGRQPWVVYHLLTTAQAATTNGGVIASLSAVVVLYAVLGVATVLILRMLAGVGARPRRPDEEVVPYGPRARCRSPAGTGAGMSALSRRSCWRC